MNNIPRNALATLSKTKLFETRCSCCLPFLLRLSGGLFGYVVRTTDGRARDAPNEMDVAIDPRNNNGTCLTTPRAHHVDHNAGRIAVVYVTRLARTILKVEMHDDVISR